MLKASRMSAVVLLAVHMLACSVWAGLREDVDRLVRSAALKGGTVSVSIRDCATGVAIVAINPDAQMVPASNMKLFTSGAALHVLGTNFEFNTKLLRDGDRLIVLGDGDPAFGDPELLAEMTLDERQGVDVESFLKFWVKPVVDAGITKISEVIVDDRIFDREFILPTWPDDQLNNRYCAQVAGLNFHSNVLFFFPRPRPGQPPDVSICRPEAPWLKLTNYATSKTSTSDKTTLGIHRKIGTNEMTFRGNVRTGYRDPIAVTLHNTPAFFAQLLADRLSKAGIAVGGHRVSLANDPPSSGVGHQIGPVITTPISTALKRCNTDSENLYAESLLKRIGFALTGEPGSWINGAAIVRHVIHQRLNDPTLASGIIITDGSGLSQENRITAAAMTAWLCTFANDQSLGPILIDSLPVAGKSGTLTKRFSQMKLHGAIVQAKTGYINRVSCLSGFVTMPDGRQRSFSVLVNNLKDPTTIPLAKKLQDQIVGAIAEDLAVAVTALGGD